MAYEEAPYNVVHSTDTYEIRHYKDRLVVEVVNKNDDNSFRKLFRYISGQNNKSEEIKMTVPVTQGEKDEGYYMQFYLPSKFTKDNAPLPNNPDIKISTIKEGISQLFSILVEHLTKIFLNTEIFLIKSLLKIK